MAIVRYGTYCTVPQYLRYGAYSTVPTEQYILLPRGCLLYTTSTYGTAVRIHPRSSTDTSGTYPTVRYLRLRKEMSSESYSHWYGTLRTLRYGRYLCYLQYGSASLFRIGKALKSLVLSIRYGTYSTVPQYLRYGAYSTVRYVPLHGSTSPHIS